MKKLSTAILLLSGYMAHSQVSLQLNGGYSVTQALPTIGMEAGVMVNKFYLSAQGLICASRIARAPVVSSLNVGYSIGQFRPFISYGWQSAGAEHTDLFKPSFQPGGGLSYLPASLPIVITGQVQGKQIIISAGMNVIFD